MTLTHKHEISVWYAFFEAHELEKVHAHVDR